jgi:hypothetical protein
MKTAIDQHYFSIASRQPFCQPRILFLYQLIEIQEAFRGSWKRARDRACNAMEACKRFECTASDLNAWQLLEMKMQNLEAASIVE